MESISQEFKKQINKSYSKLPMADLDSSEVMSNKISDLKIAKELPESDDVFSLLDVIIDDEENTETTEATGSGSAGGFVAPLQGKKEETKEATGSDSSGSYDVAFGAPRKDPLKIDNPGLKKIKEDKIPKNVKGKNKKNRYGGPEGVFVKIKEKCKKFPYCDQGDINSLEFYEEEKTISEDHNIYNKTIEMKDLKLYIESIVDKVISEREIDEMEEFYEIAKLRKEQRKSKKEEETNETEVEEGNAFSGARCKAICNNEKSFEVDGKKYDVTDASDDDCDCDNLKESTKTILKLTEEEVIDLIEKIVNEQKVNGVTQQNKSMKETEKQNTQNIKDITKKMKEYLEGYEENPETMPKTSGEISDMEKVAYEPNEEAEEYIEDFSYGSGLLGLEYDGLDPDEERQESYLEGSSKTGNASKDDDGKALGNVVPSEVGEKFNDIRKKGALAKEKAKSYNKDPQPVETVKEDVEKYKKIISYTYVSQ